MINMQIDSVCAPVFHTAFSLTNAEVTAKKQPD